jgi:Zn-dependent alcohol dehydrogenase
VAVMRQAVESARMGWGLCTIAGVAGRGEVLEVMPRFRITGLRVAGGHSAGPRGATDYMERKASFNALGRMPENSSISSMALAITSR